MTLNIDPLTAFYIAGTFIMLVAFLIALPTLIDQRKKK